MNTIGWVILLVLLIPALGIVVWVVLSASFIRIPSGRLGLLLVRGRPSDTVLGPGLHFVPAIRRRMVEIYPSVEMSYRAGGESEQVDQAGLDTWGPAVEVFLGDRTEVHLGYTVRFRLLPDGLRGVHERFGPGGISGAVRDEAAGVVCEALGAEHVLVDDLFGSAREDLQRAVANVLTATLADSGIELTGFRLRTVDLGRTGAAIQAASRARHELAAENATAATRAAQLDNDRILAELAGSEEAAARYRDTDVWRELLAGREILNVSLPGGSRLTTARDGTSPLGPPAGPAPDAGGRR
ncbi:MAG TPA: SPFH domain-containing protein [Microlunatus sp.]|nr:SPFH domain-containing protein [Microlunatus sp.]